MTATGRRILLVEDRAHRPLGHFPSRFAELAEGFAANGCVVEVLTSNGWLDEGRVAVPFVVRRYGVLHRAMHRVGEALRTTRGLSSVASWLRTVALARASRSRCRRVRGPRPDVVVVSAGIDPLVAATHAGPGRWLLHSNEEDRSPRPRDVRRAASAEQRRRRNGGQLRIVTPT